MVLFGISMGERNCPRRSRTRGMGNFHLRFPFWGGRPSPRPTFWTGVGLITGRLSASTDYRDVKRAVLLDPTNATALARLALVTANQTNNSLRFGEASLYYQRAIACGLDAQEAVRTRSQLSGVGVLAPNGGE